MMHQWGLPRYGRLLVGNAPVEWANAATLPIQSEVSERSFVAWIVAGILVLMGLWIGVWPSAKKSVVKEPAMEVLLTPWPKPSPAVDAPEVREIKETKSLAPVRSTRVESPTLANPEPSTPSLPSQDVVAAETVQAPHADAIVVATGVGSGSKDATSSSANGSGLAAVASGSGNTNGVGMVDLDREPRLLGGPAPTYPESALDEGIEAVVVASVEISAQGKVQKIAIVKSGGRDFDKAVMAAARLATYAAPVIQGVAHPAKFIRTYRFELE